MTRTKRPRASWRNVDLPSSERGLPLYVASVAEWYMQSAQPPMRPPPLGLSGVRAAAASSKSGAPRDDAVTLLKSASYALLPNDPAIAVLCSFCRTNAIPTTSEIRYFRTDDPLRPLCPACPACSAAADAT